MGKHYCDYCDVFLTHDSTSVRKAHNCGKNHLQNVRDYYASLPPSEIQGVVDTLMRDYQQRGYPPPMELVGLYGRPVRPPITRPPPTLPPGVNPSVPPPNMMRPPPNMAVPPPNMAVPPPNMSVPPPRLPAGVNVAVPPPNLARPPPSTARPAPSS